MSEGFVITAKGMTVKQLAAIEEMAGKRHLRMLPVAGHVGHITLATAALTLEIIEEARTQWGTMLFERKKLLVDLIVQSDEMTMVSPHILKMVVDLKPPVEGRLVGYLYGLQGCAYYMDR